MRCLALALILGASTLAAQSDYMHTIAAVGKVHLINRHPNCNPLAQAFDPVWIHGEGWTMPRIGWHVMYPTANYAIAKGLTKLGVNKKVAAVGATIGLGLIPHIRQAALGLKHGNVYELNAPDWIFDLWNRSLPSWALLSDRKNTKRDIAVWAAGDIALSCFARP